MKVATERLQRLRKSISGQGYQKDVRIWESYLSCHSTTVSISCLKIIFVYARCSIVINVRGRKEKFDHPAEELHPVPVPNSSWIQIGIDLIGPLPITTYGNKYVISCDRLFFKGPETHASPTKEAILMLLSFLMTSFFVMGALMKQYPIKGLSFVIRYVHTYIIKQM